MAWPRGRKRTKPPQPARKDPPVIEKPVELAIQVQAPVEAAPMSEDPPVTTFHLKGMDDPVVVAKRREICAYFVRRRPVPREIRAWDHLSLARAAKLVAKEMAEVGAGDERVEEFVSKHVRGA